MDNIEKEQKVLDEYTSALKELVLVIERVSESSQKVRDKLKEMINIYEEADNKYGNLSPSDDVFKQEREE